MMATAPPPPVQALHPSGTMLPVAIEAAVPPQPATLPPPAQTLSTMSSVAAPKPVVVVPPPPAGVSMAVHLSKQLDRPKRDIVNAIFATGVPVFGFTTADVDTVLAHLSLTSSS